MINKKRVDAMIPIAFEKLGSSSLVNDGKIDKTCRGAVSSFGAAVAMGSLISAAAFYMSDNGEIDREELSNVILQVIQEFHDTKDTTLFEYIKNGKNSAIVRAYVLDALVSIKLAMNLYKLV